MKISNSILYQASGLIEERIGIAIQTQLRGALDDILRVQAGDDLPAYVDQLRGAHETEAIWQRLVEALTIGETYFLRDKAHFTALRQRILPELIQRRRTERKRELTLYSVGCATGEEPYSLAITLHELLPDRADWRIEIIGLDLNHAALQTARRGVYRPWAFRHTDLDFQGIYFDPTPHGSQIKPHIRQMVSFRHANLLTAGLTSADMILCRNVLIYFSAAHTRRAEELLFRALTEGGWLLLGQSEIINYQAERWETHRLDQAAFYRKPLRPTAQPVTPPAAQPTPPTDNGQALYEQAASAFHAEDFNRAAQLVALLLAANPRHAAGLLLQAGLDANRRQFRAAHGRIDAALEIDPLLADAYYLRAVLFSEAGEQAEAHQALQAALYCQQNHPLAAYMLGNLYAQRGEHPRARRYWEAAQRAIQALQPESSVADVSPITARQLRALLAH